MAGPPTSTDAAGWQDIDPAASDSDSDPDMTGAPPAEAEDDLSTEDAAWVDSCLVKDGGDGTDGREGRGLSDDAWATVTEAFIDALAYSTFENATVNQDEKKVEDSSSPINGGWGASWADASGDEPMSQDGLFQADPAIAKEEASSPTASAYAATFHDRPSPTLGDSSSGREGPSAIAGQFEGTAQGSSSNGGLDAMVAVIGSEYPEEQQGYGDEDEEFPIAVGEEVDEVELTWDIFRVWALDVAEEEGDEEGAEDEEEFGWQLKKALEGSPAVAAPMPPLADDDPSAAILDDDEWRKTSAVVLDEENLEELIAGISDISLGPPSSSD